MRTFETLSFGSVVLASGDDTYVTREVSLGGATVKCSLFLAEGLGAERLAGVRALLDDLETLDARARAALRESFASDADGTVAEYLAFHLEELPDVVGSIVGSTPVTPGALLERVALSGVSAHLRVGSFVLVLDYSPGRAYTDRVLAVSFDASGAATGIEHES